MSYGRFDITQAEVVAKFVEGRVIHDLGAGDLTLASILADKLGAKKVYAVEPREYINGLPHTAHGPVEVVGEYFQDYNTRPSNVFISWPDNNMSRTARAALLRLVKRARLVIYLGHNFGGISCGFPELYEHFTHRRIIRHVPRPNNSLLVLGERCLPRKPTPEERAGLNPLRIYKWPKKYIQVDDSSVYHSFLTTWGTANTEGVSRLRLKGTP